MKNWLMAFKGVQHGSNMAPTCQLRVHDCHMMRSYSIPFFMCCKINAFFSAKRQCWGTSILEFDIGVDANYFGSITMPWVVGLHNYLTSKECLLTLPSTGPCGRSCPCHPSPVAWAACVNGCQNHWRGWKRPGGRFGVSVDVVGPCGFG